MDLKQILIIGGGSIGERHVRCFQRTGGAAVSLCELQDDVRRRVSDRYALQHSFATLDAALQRSFDAAVICVPADLHVPMAMRLVEAGLGALIEKPLSITELGVTQLIELAEARRVPVSVAYVYRSHPGLQAMKQAITSGRFGAPVEIVVTAGQHFPYYRPDYRQIYYTRHATGGGAIQDALTHLINAIEWLVGPVTRLVADADHCVLDGVQVEDTAHVLTRHGSVLGSFSLNQHQPANETTISVVCERGILRLEVHQCRWLSCVSPGSDWQVEEVFTLERDDLFVRQAERFLEQLAGTATASCSLAEGWQTLRVNLAALKSVGSRNWIEL